MILHSLYLQTKTQRLYHPQTPFGQCEEKEGEMESMNVTRNLVKMLKA